MRSISKYFRGYRLITVLLVLLVYVGSSMCHTKGSKKADKIVFGPNDNYVGSKTCVTCHKEIYDNYVRTAHYKTSAGIDTENFEKIYQNTDSVFFNDALFVTVQKREGAIYQTAFSGGRMAATHSLDMVIGSGRKGQTFLFWNDSSLYQLPLSYSFAFNRWINSPGYPIDKVIFNRVIPIKCFECHATYAEQRVNENGNPIYDSSSLVMGISCETCHGPGAKHAQFYTTNPAEKKSSFIINISKLSREQQLDACATCHSGIRENIKPAFSFLPGDKLDDFFKPDYNKDNAASLDVHGNQYGLLTASKCFKQSMVLNCSSCHNVHQVETNKIQVFAQRCMNCHNENNQNFCTVKNTDRETLINKCIDCHMPLQESHQITFNTGKKRKILYDSIRTHLIGIYREPKINARKNTQGKMKQF